MESSKYCDICKNSRCTKKAADMENMKPSCYVEYEMVEFEGNYIPKDLCSIDILGGVDDVIPCSKTCMQEECDACIVTKVFNEYARLTHQTQEKAVLIMDMPKSCSGCPLRRDSFIVPHPEAKDFIYNIDCAGLNSRQGKETTKFLESHGRPDWCPLHEYKNTKK